MAWLSWGEVFPSGNQKMRAVQLTWPLQRRQNQIHGMIFKRSLLSSNNKATHSMDEATAYCYRKWLNLEEIRPIPEKYQDVWRLPQVEAKVCNSSDPYQSEHHHHLDMWAAYLACKDSAMGVIGDAISPVHEYEFLMNMIHQANVGGFPLSDILSLTGAI